MIVNIAIIAIEHNIGTIIGSCLSLNIKNMFTKISTIAKPIITITPSINPKLYFPPFTELRFYRRMNHDSTYETIQANPNPNTIKIATNIDSSPPLIVYHKFHIFSSVHIQICVFQSLCNNPDILCSAMCLLF